MTRNVRGTIVRTPGRVIPCGKSRRAVDAHGMHGESSGVSERASERARRSRASCRRSDETELYSRNGHAARIPEIIAVLARLCGKHSRI